MRAAQSKGAIDLLALFPRPFVYIDAVEKPWLVQCKYSVKGGGRLSAHDEIELVALADAINAVPVLARPGKNGRGVEFVNLYTKDLIG